MGTNTRFMTTGSGGKVHYVTTKSVDLKTSSCPVVKNGHLKGTWGRKKGVSADAALALDECSRCRTHTIAKSTVESAKTPEQKRVEAKERADATREKMKPKQNRPKNPPKGKDHPKSVRKSGGGMTRSGKSMESMIEKATEHLEVAKDNGWKGELIKDAVEVKVEATKKGELLRLIYADGRINHARVTLANGTEVKLRNSANWLRYARGEMKVKGNPVGRRTGKKALKAEVEADEKNGVVRNVPFLLDDDDDVIIKALGGLQITWRNFTSGGLETARVPSRSRNVRISTHPKSGKKMISFHELQGETEHGELLGGERVVLLERILRAK